MEEPLRKPDEGIVTLCDRHYFEGLKMLAWSVQESHAVPIACFDIGLTDAQKQEAAEVLHLVRILPLPWNEEMQCVRSKLSGDRPLAKSHKRQWPLWICPFLIAHSPFQRVLWLDCDIVVLRALSGLFELLDEGPVFTPENNAPEFTVNQAELYRLLPIPRDFSIEEPKVNGGVSGWDLRRDRAILADYGRVVLEACKDEAIRQAISWHDQGCLIWAIQNNGLEDRVVSTNRWNLCVRHTQVAGRYHPWERGILVRLRADVPEANLLHWNGVPVPWEGLFPVSRSRTH